MSNPIVVDLSHWNPEPDWLALKAGGTLGVILKATQGKDYIDPTFHDRARGAVKAGLYVTAYHFLEKGNIPDQIMHYTETLEFMHGLVLPRAVIDYEDINDDVSATLTDLIGAVEALKLLGYQVAIYSGHKIKADVGNDYYGGLADTSLWIAQYTEASAPTWPINQWVMWDLWQYTDKADVSGISDPVDGNRWNDTASKLEDWFYPHDEDVPEGSKEFVSISIDVSDGVALKIFVNGEPYG